MTRAKPWDPNKAPEMPHKGKPWEGWTPPAPEQAECDRKEYEARYQASLKRDTLALPWE